MFVKKRYPSFYILCWMVKILKLKKKEIKENKTERYRLKYLGQDNG